jgi:alpha-L-rhamnosidase
VVAGLAPAEPGYRRLLIRPRPGTSLTAASARLRTPYGVAEAEWRLVEGRFELRVEVPPNTRAEVLLPGADPVDIGSGSHAFHQDLNLTSAPAVD